MKRASLLKGDGYVSRERLTIRPLGGLRQGARGELGEAEEMVNFTVTDQGRLTLRPGVRALHLPFGFDTRDQEIRGLWAGFLEREELLAVATSPAGAYGDNGDYIQIFRREEGGFVAAALLPRPFGARGIDRSSKEQEGAGRAYSPERTTAEEPAGHEAPAATTREPEPTAAPEEVSDPAPTGNTFTTASGEVVSYSRKLTVDATAYSCEGYTGTTATGTTARYGAIAVDPSVIPYGTRMYIVSDDGSYIYGYATAEDCGGAIQGYMIDLYFDTLAECYAFGRRSCTVYILD